MGRNPGRGWNPNLEESYLPEYSESEAESFIQGTPGFYFWQVKIAALDTSSILRYSECTKTTSFSILGFFRLRVKLGFDFPGVLPNQKSQPWSLNFYFDEEINLMLGSPKNSSSMKSPNFPQQKLKMPKIKICFDRKMIPSMESYPRLIFLMISRERPKK